MVFEKIKDKFLKPFNRDVDNVEGAIRKAPFKEDSSTEEVKEDYSFVNSNGITSVLGVQKVININGMVKTEDIGAASFTLVAPTGYDPKEVMNFLNKIKGDLNTYRKIIRQRDEDVNKLYKELDRVETQLQEERQKRELESFVARKDNKIDELENTIINLQMENTELKQKIESFNSIKKTADKKETTSSKAKKILPDLNSSSPLPNLNENAKKRKIVDYDEVEIISDADILSDADEKEGDSFLSMLDELDLN